jgi:nitrate/nitrite transporter NarK
VRDNLCILMFGAYVGFQFVLTLYYQDELDWSPLQAGLAFLLGAVLTGATARYAAVAVTRFGSRPVATLGLLTLGVGYLAWALLIGHTSTMLILLVQQVLGGIGFAAAYTALNIAAVGGARQDEQGLASGLFNAASQIGAGSYSRRSPQPSPRTPTMGWAAIAPACGRSLQSPPRSRCSPPRESSLIARENRLPDLLTRPS